VSPAIREALKAGGMGPRGRVALYAAIAQESAYEAVEHQHRAEHAATAACRATSTAHAAALARVAADAARAAYEALQKVMQQHEHAIADADANDLVAGAFVEAITALEVAARGCAREAAAESEQAQAAAHELSKRALAVVP